MHATRPSTPRRGIVVSDLHLFSRRSRGLELVESLKPDLREVDVFVLNGDTFDFRWSTHGVHEASEAAAMEWLNGLLESLAHGEVHYILGNHDYLASFRDKLRLFVAEHPRLHCHEHSLQLGDRLFLHGDVTHRKMNETEFRRYRGEWTEDRTRGPVAASFYSMMDRLGAPHVAHAAWHLPRIRTVRRIIHYLDHAQPRWRHSIRDCYFGHTHFPFTDFEYEGVRYHNTGSAIRHLKFNPLRFDVA